MPKRRIPYLCFPLSLSLSFFPCLRNTDVQLPKPIIGSTVQYLRANLICRSSVGSQPHLTTSIIDFSASRSHMLARCSWSVQSNPAGSSWTLKCTNASVASFFNDKLHPLPKLSFCLNCSQPQQQTDIPHRRGAVHTPYKSTMRKEKRSCRKSTCDKEAPKPPELFTSLILALLGDKRTRCREDRREQNKSTTERKPTSS